MLNKLKSYVLIFAIFLTQFITPVSWAAVIEYNSNSTTVLFGPESSYITQEGGTFYNGTLTTTYTGER